MAQLFSRKKTASTPTVPPVPLAHDLESLDLLESQATVQPLDSAALPNANDARVFDHSQHRLRHPVVRTASIVAAIAVLTIGPAVGYFAYQSHKQRQADQSASIASGAYDQSAPSASGLDVATASLDVRSRLRVLNSAEINSLSVSGTSRLQGAVSVDGGLSANTLVVGGQTVIDGRLLVQDIVTSGTIQGNLTGVVSGSLSGVFTGSGSGSFTGNFNGRFGGDGSALTNLKASSCQDCVRLQMNNATMAQAGDIIVSGTIRAAALSILAAANQAQVLSVQTATGEQVLSADALNKYVSVGDLRPLKASTYDQGISIPGSTQNNATSRQLPTITGSGPSIGQLRDGRSSYAYTNNDDKLHYSVCIDTDCTQSVDQELSGIESNAVRNITIDNNDLPYIFYTNTATSRLELVHCSDTLCAEQSISIPFDLDGNVFYASYQQLLPDGKLALYLGTYRLDSQTDSGYVVYNDLYLCAPTSCQKSASQFGGAVDGQSLIYSMKALTTGAIFAVKTSFEDGSLQLIRCEDIICQTPSSVDLDIPAEEGNVYAIVLAEDGSPTPKIFLTSYTLVGNAYVHKHSMINCRNATCSLQTRQSLFTSQINHRVQDVVFHDGVFKVSITGEYYDEDYNSVQSTTLYVCNDAACTNGMSYDILDGQAQVTKLLPNGDRLDAIGLNDDSGIMTYQRDVQPAEILPVYRQGSVTLGNAIGSSSERFGQIYAGSLDLQSAGSAAGLTINKITGLVDTADGLIANFTVNGVSKAAFAATGDLVLGQAADQAQINANLTLLGAGNSKQLIDAKRSDGATVFTVRPDGSIQSGTSSCDGGCLPSEFVSSVDVPGGSSEQQFSKAGNILYVTSSASQYPTPADYKALHIYDIANPLAPKLLTSAEAGGGSRYKMVINGRYGYFFDNDGVTKVYDLVEPARPKLLTTSTVIHDRGYINTAPIVRDNKLIMLQNSYLRTYDISNPNSIAFLGETNLNGYVYNDMVARGTMVYLMNGNTLLGVDISNASTPFQVAEYEVPDSEDCFGLTSDDNMLYAICSDYRKVTLHAIVIDNGSTATVREVARSLGTADASLINYRIKAMEYRRGIVYALGHDSKLYAYDISDMSKSSLTTVGVVQGRVTTTAFSGDYLYYNELNQGKLNIVGAAKRSTISSLDTSTLAVTGVALIEGDLNVADAFKVSGGNVTISDVAIPRITSKQSAPDGGQLVGDPALTYYYRLAGIDALGRESAASPEIAFPATDFSKLETISAFPPIAAVGDDPGQLNGSYRYTYTYVSSRGESTGNARSNDVTVTNGSVRVQVPRVSFNGYNDRVTKVYRCSLPACSSYQYVGTASIETGDNDEDAPYVFIDTQGATGASLPTVNTAYTDTNVVGLRAPRQPGIIGYKVYRSTVSGSGYVSQYVPVNEYGYIEDVGTIGTVATPLNKTNRGKLGIGTSTPTKDLDVVGNGRFRSQANEVDAFQVQNAAGDALFSVDSLNSRVGIGTGTPAATLQISGAQAGVPLFQVNDTSTSAPAVFTIADGGGVTLRNQTDSGGAFQVQNAAGNAFITANSLTSTLTVTNLVITSSLTVRGHIRTDNASGATTVAAGAAAGTGASCVITGNDTTGRVVINTGSANLTSGTLCTVTFSSSYAAPPNVQLTPATVTAAGLQYYGGPVTNNDFGISVATPAGANMQYFYYYLTLQ